MFCPKCGLEYREGFTECAYCHIPLVDELPEGVDADKLSAKVLDGEEDPFDGTLLSREELLEQARARGLSEKDLIRAAEDIHDEESLNNAASQLESEIEEENHKPYRTAADKVSDVQSSGYTLVGVGAIGMVGLLLCILGVVPLSVGGPGMFVTYGTMGVLFLVFLFAGIRSLMRVAPLMEEAEREQEKIEEIEKYFTDNYDAERIDEEAFDSSDALQEDEYYARTRVMKRAITDRFIELDGAFLEFIVDDLYQDIYESEDDEDEEFDEEDEAEDEVDNEVDDEETDSEADVVTGAGGKQVNRNHENSEGKENPA